MDKMEYKRAFDSVSAPSDIKERILSRVSPTKRSPIRRTVLVLWAVLVLTCTVALASGAAGEWLNALIRLNGQEVPTGNVHLLNQTAEDGGVRITLTEAISDGINAYLLLDMEALEGQSFVPSDTLPIEESIYITERIEPQIGGGFRATRLDDGSSPANARVVLEYSFDESVSGQEIAVTITSLKAARDMQEDGVKSRLHDALAEGEWTFRVQIQDNMEIARYTFGDYDVSISAIGITVEGMGDASILNSHLALRLKDGSEVELTSGGISRTLHNDQVTSAAYRARLTELVDPTQATVLLIDGVEYTLLPA